eukprot:gnl/TRDRNA2_/TRDRNA2_165644_c0_seq1.p1 gnl/TRDRNA2_/TRDRNA2_165644_c0~~gnl/TRDRNA2_/TRDRNA2_165644_c0_seq1.p1  ORF type:complete len:468 (-),score=32.91 gnl/TRDRNA2_/TRDRNA2_165644_c0_seq1:117-1520(-)
MASNTPDGAESFHSDDRCISQYAHSTGSAVEGALGVQPIDCWPVNSDGIHPPCWQHTTLQALGAQWPGRCSDMKVIHLRGSNADMCKASCVQDSLCAVWMTNGAGGCWHGIGYNCYTNQGLPSAAGRIQHGKVFVIKDLKGIEVKHLGIFEGGTPIGSAVSIANCRDICYSNLKCGFWQYSEEVGCLLEDPDEGNVVPKPPTATDINRTSDTAGHIVAGEYIVHYCPPSPKPQSLTAPEGATQTGTLLHKGVTQLPTSPPASALHRNGSSQNLMRPTPAPARTPAGLGLNWGATQVHHLASGSRPHHKVSIHNRHNSTLPTGSGQVLPEGHSNDTSYVGIVVACVVGVALLLSIPLCLKFMSRRKRDVRLSRPVPEVPEEEPLNSPQRVAMLGTTTKVVSPVSRVEMLVPTGPALPMSVPTVPTMPVPPQANLMRRLDAVETAAQHLTARMGGGLDEYEIPEEKYGR